MAVVARSVHLDGDEHRMGESGDCDSCWSGYPIRHAETEFPNDECGGWMHASFGDENSDGDYWLYTTCDACGESE